MKNTFKKRVEKVTEEKTKKSKKFIMPEETRIVVKDFSLFYDGVQALWDINLVIPKRNIIALIGPSGSGKSSSTKNI